VHCGPTGVANIEKRHQGSKTCIAARQKQDKQAMAKKKTTLLTFFGSAKVTKATPAIPPTIHQSALVYSHIFTPEKTPDKPVNITPASKDDIPASEDVAMPVHPPSNRGFLEELHDLISSVPDSIPEALDQDVLAIFTGNPHEIDDPSLNRDELWEELLNGMMKSAFGWGDEGNMEDIIRRGRKGLDGLLNFVKHGVSEGLFEGKLMNLMNALENM
jgi:hypothetical protein